MFSKNRLHKIDKTDFQRRAVTVDARQGWDDLFASLEQAMAQNTYILVEQCLHDDGAPQVISRFVSRYKVLVEYCHIDPTAPGRCYIKLKQTWSKGEKTSYADLQGTYTESYYLTDCGGYDIFLASNGHNAEMRLQNVLALAAPRPGERILDIGCGRGELSYLLAQSGADVTGVDYSADAIRIARRTYGASPKYTGGVY